MGFGKLINSADVLVENNDDLAQFQQQIRMWLDTLIQASNSVLQPKVIVGRNLSRNVSAVICYG